MMGGDTDKSKAMWGEQNCMFVFRIAARVVVSGYTDSLLVLKLAF